MGKRAAGGENLVQIWPRSQRTPPSLRTKSTRRGGGFFARITPDLENRFEYIQEEFPDYNFISEYQMSTIWPGIRSQPWWYQNELIQSDYDWVGR